MNNTEKQHHLTRFYRAIKGMSLTEKIEYSARSRKSAIGPTGECDSGAAAFGSGGSNHSYGTDFRELESFSKRTEMEGSGKGTILKMFFSGRRVKLSGLTIQPNWTGQFR